MWTRRQMRNSLGPVLGGHPHTFVGLGISKNSQGVELRKIPSWFWWKEGSVINELNVHHNKGEGFY